MKPTLAALFVLAMAGAASAQQTIHPDVAGPDVKAAPVPARTVPAINQPAQQLGPPNARTGRPYKGGLWGADYDYVLAPGITSKEVVWWSENVACYAKIFYPKDYNPAGRTPAVVLAQGWAGTHWSIEKYGERMAEKGLVAMVIDYRGWGASDGVPRLLTPVRVGGTSQRDVVDGKTQVVTTQVEMTRTKLSATDQQRDVRNAISYIQGEPGVDAARIGVWGSSYAGGNALAVAGQDNRVKAVSVQIPALQGPATFTQMGPPGGQADAIRRARTGRGGEIATGYSRIVAVDVDQGDPPNHRAWAQLISRPTQVVVAEFEELNPNAAAMEAGLAAVRARGAPLNVITVPRVTHFEMYVNTLTAANGQVETSNAFEISANAAADWFAKYLNDPQATQPGFGVPPPPARGGAAPPAAAPAPGRGG
jgi:dienelactone hydrolase